MRWAWLAACGLASGCGGGGSAADAPTPGADAPVVDAARPAPDALMCTSPQSDCNDDATDGCETNLDTSPTNCGSCGHDCLGGACLTGSCQPVELINGILEITGFDIDADHVYWSSRGTNSGDFLDGYVRRLSLAGGVPMTLAFDQAYAASVTVADGTIYWLSGIYETAQIRSMSASSMDTPATIAAGYSIGSQFVTDSHVYWTEVGNAALSYTDGSIHRMPRAGGAPETLVDAVFHPMDVVATDDVIVWRSASIGGAPEEAAVYRAPISGGTPQMLLDFATNGATADAERAWLTETGEPTIGFADAAIYSIGPTGPAEVVPIEVGRPDKIVVHEGLVFFLEFPRESAIPTRVVQLDPASNTTEVIYEGFEAPFYLRVDATSVYVVTKPGFNAAIWRIAR